MGFASKCFRSPRVRQTFWAIFPWSPLRGISKNGRFCVFAKLAIARSCEHFWGRSLRQNLVRWLHFKPILIKRPWDLRRVVLGAREFGLLFWRFSLGVPFEEFQKLAGFGVFAKLALARSCEHFWSGGLRANVVRLFHLNRVLIRRRWDLRRGVLVARDFGVLFGRFSLDYPFEEFQKIADFGFFSKLAMAQSCGHYWSRGLRQNVVRWLHFKPILIWRRWGLCRGVLGAREFGLLFGRFSLCSPLWRILKNCRFWCLCKVGHSSELQALLEPRFAAKCCSMMAL